MSLPGFVVTEIEQGDLIYGPGSDDSLAYAGNHAITNLSVGDVSAMTSAGHQLYIVGDTGDSVMLAEGWIDKGVQCVYEHVVCR